jgi:GAF domain-containing protein
VSTPQDVEHRTALVEALGVLGAGPEERFDRITRMTQEAFGVPLSFLNLVHHDVVTSQSAIGWGQGGSVPVDAVMCSATVLQDEPLVVPDTTLDPRFREMVAVTEHGVRFYAGAPLTMFDGTRVGTLCIMDAEPRTLSAADVALLRDLAHWAERELGFVLERDHLQRVRAGLVPDPVAVGGHDLATLTTRPSEDGGDVADWRVAADGALHLTVGTVTAGGRASALIAAGVRSALAARADLPITSAVAELEAQVTPDLRVADALVHLVHARLHPTTGRVDVVDAGLGTALHVRADGSSERVRSSTLPIGLGGDAGARPVLSVELAAGDRLVLASDGVLAAPGVETVAALAEAVTAEPDAAAGVEHVRSRLPERGPADATLVVVTRR